MKISILNSSNFITSQWSGGSSTQLYIFPDNASYADRNFELRISTAKVEIAESTFTSLPGIRRKLMILDGEIQINHQGQYTKNLKPFDVDSFSGDWVTTALGTCTDFNVMNRCKKQTDLYAVEIGTRDYYELIPGNVCEKLLIYAYSGGPELELMNRNYRLNTGNLLIVESPNDSSIAIKSTENSVIVVVEIYPDFNSAQLKL